MKIWIDIFPKKTYRCSTCMYMKRCFTSLILMETQIKPQWVIRSHLLECLFRKITNSKQWWEHGEKRTLGCVCEWLWLFSQVNCKKLRVYFFPSFMHFYAEGNGNPTSVFLPGKSHGQRSQAGYSPGDGKRVRHNLETKQQSMHF